MNTETMTLTAEGEALLATTVLKRRIDAQIGFIRKEQEELRTVYRHGMKELAARDRSGEAFDSFTNNSLQQMHHLSEQIACTRRIEEQLTKAIKTHPDRPDLIAALVSTTADDFGYLWCARSSQVATRPEFWPEIKQEGVRRVVGMLLGYGA